MSEVSSISVKCSDQSRRNTGQFSSDDLQHEADRLIDGSLSLNTMKTYETGLSVFNNFLQLHGFEVVWPPSLEKVVQFVAYMSLKDLSANTAKSYISAVGFKCKITGCSDVTQNFIVHKVLEGMKRLKNRADTRLPLNYTRYTSENCFNIARYLFQYV